jgi:hypothetical protein
MKESDSHDEHFRSMIVITVQLATIKAPIPEDEHAYSRITIKPDTFI